MKHSKADHPPSQYPKSTIFDHCLSCKIINSLCLFFSLQVLIIYTYSYTSIPFPNIFNKLSTCGPQIAPIHNSSNIHVALNKMIQTCDPEIVPFYVYELPYRFNGLIMKDCSKIHQWHNFCPYMVNHGFGPHSRRPNWYTTNQFFLEPIFHARTLNHPCRTYDPESARLFFIPFYITFYTTYMFHAPNDTVRDAMAFDLVDYLSSFPSFLRRGGNDHFIVGSGNIGDINRPEPNTNWYPATRLIRLPAFVNVSVLVWEREIKNVGSNHFAIPYPSYFHPTKDSEMVAWQEEMRQSERNHLFAFIGGGRTLGENETITLRSEILNLCQATKHCLLMNCTANQRLCEYDADWVMGVLKRAQFCVQPRGDTWTRRSMFDSVLAGCIPVFFSEHTAYDQYTWYIPENRDDWSVFIEQEKVSQIEQILFDIPNYKVEKMRNTLIDMIPRFTYVNDNATRISFRDAVDVALIELTKRVDGMSNVPI